MAVKRSVSRAPVELERHTDHVDAARYLDSLRAEGSRMGSVARKAGLAAMVPTCPGWTVADLLVHTATVYRRIRLLSTIPTQRPPRVARDPDAPPVDQVPDWFDEALAGLVGALEAADPSTTVWTWWPPDQTAGFWFRRMAQETAIHRADAEAALGPIGPVAMDLAIDGIDEALERYLVPRVGLEVVEGPPVTVHLHATDGPGEWLVGLGPDGLTVQHGHAKGDAAARGTASDLLLWLWGRLPVDRLERFGDAAAIDRLRAAAATVT